MRRYGEPWRAGAPYRDRPGIYAVILDGRGDVLAAKTSAEGENFLLPGGGIDPGETPMRALHREVMEETGWTIAPVRRLGAFQRYCFMPEYGIWARKVCHLHLALAGLRLGPPAEPDHRPVWMAPDVAVRLLSLEGERAALAALFGAARSAAKLSPD